MGTDATRVQRAGGSVAAPRSAGWMLVNPASVTALEKRVDAAFFLSAPKISLRGKGVLDNPGAGDLHSGGVHPGASMGGLWPSKSGMWALGFYIPLTDAVEFPHSRNILAGLLGGSKDRRLQYRHVQLALAHGWKLDGGWSAGLALRGSISLGRTDSYTPALTPTEGDYQWDDALGVGTTAGVFWQGKRVAWGLALASRQWSQEFNGAYGDLLKHPVDTPFSLQTGVAIQIRPKLTFSLDAQYLWWSDVAFFGRDPAYDGLGWHDQFGFKATLEWRASDKWTFAAGWSHMASPLPSRHTFINALTPALIEDTLTGGLSRRIGKRGEMHLALAHALPNESKDSGQGGFLSLLARDSKVRITGTTLALGYTLRFQAR
jgi:long-subunit fatty acid transport protein